MRLTRGARKKLERSPWAHKRVLVTGADGFVGSHLVEALLDLDAKVIAFTRGTSTHGTAQLSLRRIAHVQGRLETVIAANIGSPETSQIIRDQKPDVILHLAAEAYVPKSFDQPGEVFAVNATGTLHVLEAARRLPSLTRLVVTSSSEVYGTADDDRPIDEEHPLRPTSPYAASKCAADRLAYSYRVTFGLPLAIIRPFNTYGPRHTYDVIPKFIRLALEGKDLTVHGDGSQARDFTFVSDTVAGFLAMGSDQKAIGEIVNFGSGQSHSIKHTAERILALSKSGSRIVVDATRPAEVRHLLCDNRKAQRLFGWTPRVDFDTGLAQNIEWERRRLAGASGA